MPGEANEDPGRPENSRKGNSSQESAAAEIPVARSVQGVLAGGGISAAISLQPETIFLCKLERKKRKFFPRKKEKKSIELRALYVAETALKSSTQPGRTRSLSWGVMSSN